MLRLRLKRLIHKNQWYNPYNQSWSILSTSCQNEYASLSKTSNVSKLPKDIATSSSLWPSSLTKPYTIRTKNRLPMDYQQTCEPLYSRRPKIDPRSGSTTTWYCAVRSKLKKVVLKTYNLKEAQNALNSIGTATMQQAIIPMVGRVSGDPHDLDKTWDGGSMYWCGWDCINSMKQLCELETPPVLSLDQRSINYKILMSNNGSNSSNPFDYNVGIPQLTTIECDTLCALNRQCNVAVTSLLSRLPINSVDDGVLSDIEVSGACSVFNEQNIVTNALDYFNQKKILKLPLEQMCEKNCNSVINDVGEMKAMKKKCRHLW